MPGVAAALGLVALLLAAPESTAVDPGRPPVLVRVHLEAAPTLPARAAAEALDLAREIWRPYADVRFAWSEEAIAPGMLPTLHLIVLDQQPIGRPPHGLGWIDFVDGRPSTTLTVSVGAVRQMMEASTWNGKRVAAMPGKIRDAFVTRALGRAAAHEIGHYLLASKAHARSGLMRAHMTSGEIMRADHREDHLDPSDVERLRGTLLRYAGQRRPSVSDPAASDPHRSGW